ncbi:hypothetical protein Tco_1195062, partial [Tanacetum coccineum]
HHSNISPRASGISGPALDANTYGRGFENCDTHRGTNRRCMPHAQVIHWPHSNGQEAMLSNSKKIQWLFC